MTDETKALEKEAYAFLVKEEYQEAFNLFARAADIYKRKNSHENAALCFASAASCWSKKSGEKLFYNAAFSYEAAARQAQQAGDLEYASVLYKYAAVNYERDREFFNYSDCFYRSRECYRKFLTYCFICPAKIHSITPIPQEAGVRGVLKRVFAWFILTVSFTVWGHGERPSRTFFSGILVISTAAVFYTFGYLLHDGAIFEPNFFQSLYFSVITFTTVGYGDFAPYGWSKIVAMVESFSGIFIMPLFLIGLSRKYLRI